MAAMSTYGYHISKKESKTDRRKERREVEMLHEKATQNDQTAGIPFLCAKECCVFRLEKR